MKVLRCPSHNDTFFFFSSDHSIQFSRLIAEKDKKVKVTGEVTEVVLPNLVKGRIYRISVAALSSAGPGPENVKNFTFTGSKETG